jgi:hypothetical protein
MKPSAVSNEQWLKVGKTALWLAGSAVAAYFTSLLTDSPELFGAYLPLANLLGVVLKQVFSEK